MPHEKLDRDSRYIGRLPSTTDQRQKGVHQPSTNNWPHGYAPRLDSPPALALDFPPRAAVPPRSNPRCSPRARPPQSLLLLQNRPLRPASILLGYRFCHCCLLRHVVDHPHHPLSPRTPLPLHSSGAQRLLLPPGWFRVASSTNGGRAAGGTLRAAGVAPRRSSGQPRETGIPAGRWPRGRLRVGFDEGPRAEAAMAVSRARLLPRGCEAPGLREWCRS